MLVLAACTDRTTHAKLICHNANCTAQAAFDADDTLAALRASLALRTRDGHVVFDGMELDSVWDRARGGCTFSHTPRASAAPLGDAVALVAAHVASAAEHRAAYGEVFFIKIELKVDVGGGARHTPEETAAHAACVTEAARAVVRAGVASLNPVIPIFDSDDPGLLAAIDPAPFAAEPARGYLFETNWGTLLPAGFAPQILTVGWYEAPQELEWDLARMSSAGAPGAAAERGGLAIWARSPPPADLYAMLTHRPAYIVVNNAEEARGLLEGAIPY